MSITLEFDGWLRREEDYEVYCSLNESPSGETPNCPKCGSPMVLRTARSGKSAGSQFYGCSRFPNCNGTMGYKPSPQPGQPAAKTSTTGQQPAPSQSSWVYSRVVKADHRFGAGESLAVSKSGNRWLYVKLGDQRDSGILSDEEVRSGLIQSYRDANGKPLMTTSPSDQDLKQKLSAQQVDQKPQGGEKKSSPLIPDELMSDEQRAIDEEFGRMMSGDGPPHMMIDALAGSGKTTILRHLAWKYGRPGERWLYLVFNTKNKAEAVEKFPPFVDVRTTNGFLGEVLKDKSNFNKIPQTDRIASLANFSREEGASRLEKARLVLDGPQFSKLMVNLGIPENFDVSEYGKAGKTINSLMRAIRYSFKEQTLTLTNLAKSFALDPRNRDALREGLAKILDSYDFDTILESVKERIAGYKGQYGIMVRQALDQILKYDFMQKNYKDEILSATEWLLDTTMPHATDQQHRLGQLQHDLGQYRDFNDDLWYASTFADQITWPKYKVVLADETQDFNANQKVMLDKLAKAGAKIVAVGDKNQALYRFRGADSQAFDNIKSMLSANSPGHDITKTLTSNYRSRKAIIDFANSETHVKNLKQGKKFPDGGEGVVTKGDVKYDNAFDILNKERSKGEMMPTAFIARTNEPLVHSALKLLTDGTPFVIIGKDIAKDLKNHIKKMSGRFQLREDDSVSNLAEKLDSFLQDEKEEYAGESRKKAYLQELEEVTNALLSAISQYEKEEENSNYRPHQRYGYGSNNNRATVQGFGQWIGKRLGGLDVEENERDLKEYRRKMEEENPVVLTTAHKSKGLEFPRVYILRYDQFPHKKAKREEDLAQEDNARFVSLTRAQDELHILDLEGQPGYKK